MAGATRDGTHSAPSGTAGTRAGPCRQSAGVTPVDHTPSSSPSSSCSSSSCPSSLSESTLPGRGLGNTTQTLEDSRHLPCMAKACLVSTSVIRKPHLRMHLIAFLPADCMHILSREHCSIKRPGTKFNCFTESVATPGTGPRTSPPEAGLDIPIPVARTEDPTRILRPHHTRAEMVTKP